MPLFTAQEISSIVPRTKRGIFEVSSARQSLERTHPDDNDGEAMLAAQERLYGEMLEECCRQEYARILQQAAAKGWKPAAFTARVKEVMAQRHVSLYGEACVGHARAVLAGRL